LIILFVQNDEAQGYHMANWSCVLGEILAFDAIGEKHIILQLIQGKPLNTSLICEYLETKLELEIVTTITILKNVTYVFYICWLI
jgi:hypothetical protein